MPNVLYGSAVEALVSFCTSAINRVRSVPLSLWIYIAAVLYTVKRISYVYLGQGTERVRLHTKQKVDLSFHEKALSGSIINPCDITDTLESVGGLEDAKQKLTEHIIWPFSRPDLFQGKLRSHPTGILLHGPPGTGKTLLARALAKEINGYFLAVSVETLFSKWVGDSEKLVASVFSLAKKLEPCVIFIDEVDTLLDSRSAGDSTVYTHAKAIFMTQWSGLAEQQSRIVVVGATNRPRVLDDAFQRRFPIRIHVPPPDERARRHILVIHLKEELGKQPDGNDLLDYVAGKTNWYTGSDLKELCKVASMITIRGVMNGACKAPTPYSIKVFDEALQSVFPSNRYQ